MAKIHAEQIVATSWWAAIRETEGRRWIDVGSIGCDYDDVWKKVRETDLKCGAAWANVNLAVTVTPIKISTVEPEDDDDSQADFSLRF